MRLIDLSPRWLLRDGKRVGFVFVSPTDAAWRQSCFAVVTPSLEQWAMFEAMFGEYYKVQGCEQIAWTVAGGIENATFETMTVTPSLDGSKGGLWHGFITNGEIVGGI